MSIRRHHKAIRPAVFAVACLVAIALQGGAVHAAGVNVPPSAGAIQRQIQPAQPLPLPPGQVFNLPRPRRQHSASKVRIPVSKIDVHGNTLLPTARLEALVKPAEGRVMLLDQLQQVVERITQAYHDAGYPLAYAYLPQQKIRNGEVTVNVVEARYGKISVTGRSKLKPSVALRTVGVAPGEMIEEARITRGLILLSQTPGVTAHAVFKPGQKPETSDMQLDVNGTPRLVGDVYANNSGNKAVGATLIGASGTFNDPFGYGSAVSLNAMATPRNEAHLAAGGLAVNSPYIWNGLRVGAYGSITRYHLGESFTPLNESGRADQGGLDATYPLLLAPGRSLVARVDLLRNWLSQTSSTLASIEDEAISIERFSLSGSYVDEHGGITQGVVSLSHGHLTISEPAPRATDAAGPHTAGGFDILTLQLTHTQALPQNFVLQASVFGQLTDRNLDSSQKFYLGGPNGVMGYSVGDGGGDEGYFINLELSHRVPLRGLPGRLLASILAQYGKIHVNHHDYAAYGSRNVLTESSIGPKITYAWRGWSLMATYGFRLSSYTGSGAVHRSTGEFWLSISKSFEGLAG